MLSRLTILIVLFVQYHLLGAYYIRLHSFEGLAEQAKVNPLALVMGSAEILLVCSFALFIGVMVARVFLKFLQATPSPYHKRVAFILEALLSMLLLFLLMVFVNYYFVGT